MIAKHAVAIYPTFVAILKIINNKIIFSWKQLAEVKKAKLDLRELEDRHQELLKLEKGIQQVRDLFVDIAVLVTEQVRRFGY